jgi:hypothetical protein
MNFTDNIINDKLRLELVFVELAQLQGEHFMGIVIAGTGKIVYKNGKLTLIFKANNLMHAQAAINKLWSLSRRGDLLDQSHQFRLSGQMADSTDISVDYVFPTHFNSEEIEIPIKEVYIKTLTNEIFLAKMLIAGNYSLPFNKVITSFSDMGKVIGWRRERFYCSLVENMLIDFVSYSGHMEIYFYTGTHHSELNLQSIRLYCNRLLEAFSILQANYIQACYTQINLNRETHYYLKDALNYEHTSYNSIPQPLKIDVFGCVDSVVSFINAYLGKFNDTWNDYFLFWYKINSVAEGYPEVLSMVLSISIEGIINSFFDYTRQNSSIKNEHKIQAKNLVESIENQALRSKILNAINYANINGMKKQLEMVLDDNKINTKFRKSLVKAWTQLRNDCAHANKIYLKDDTKFEEHNKLQKQTFTLFYILLFIVLKYDKTFFDYSCEQYPLKNISDIKI